MGPLFLIGLLTTQGGAAQMPPPDLRVVVTGSVYHPDGGVTGETTTVADASPSVRFVFSRRSLCDTAPVAAAEPVDAGFGWRVASHVVRQSESEAVITVDWRRVWDRGQRVQSGPAGSVQLTLTPGDRIPLDHIPNLLPGAGCRAVGMGLELRLGRSASLPRTVDQTLPSGARAGGAGSLDVDLWLVHTTPSGSQRAQHQTVRLTAAGGMFTFAPLRFETTRGEAGIELTGSFQRFSATGGELMLVSMSRVIRGGSVSSAGLGGSSSGLIGLPGPDEVLSFEMTTATAGPSGRGGGRGGAMSERPPPGAGARSRFAGSSAPPPGARGVRGGRSSAQGTASGSPNTAAAGTSAQIISLLDGHRFALRVRVTPVPGT